MDILDERPEDIEEALDEIGVERDEKTVILGILGWAKRMSENFGETIFDNHGNQFDWGQALCREQFGPNWHQHMQTNNISKPTNADLDRALEWENGVTPDWIDRIEKA
jgi:hypothetical protein